MDPSFSIPNALMAAMQGGQQGTPSYIGSAMQDYQNGTQQNANTGLTSAMAMAMMNPQGWQGQQQTPVSQAMNPNVTTGGAVTSQPQGQPQANPNAPAMGMTPIQQQFNNQASNPNLALGQGLMSAGGAMLQGRNLMDGLGAAASNFGPAYNNTLNMQRELNTPKVTPIGQDGAFSIVQMPGQQPVTVANGDVQDFVRSKMAAQFAYETLGRQQTKDGQVQVQSAALDAKQGVIAQNNLQTLTQSQQGLAQAQALNEQLKADPARLNALQLYSNLPAAAQKAAVISGNQAMIQAQTDLQTRSNAQLDGTKLEVSGLNGGSDEVVKKGFGAVPAVDSDPANWDSYFQRAAPILQERIGFYGDVANRGLGAGNRTVNVNGTNDRPVVQNTLGPNGGSGTGPQGASVPRVTDQASYNAIPPGGYYMTPQGQYKQKGTQ